MLMDRAPLERVRKLADGRIAAVARFARSGVYTYSGAEVGRPHLSSVNVYRPESEVFSQDAMASFGHKAVTFHHPSDGVSAANWSKVSVGFTEGKIARDGGYVEIPLMLADAQAVGAYERGEARELSAGYSCDLVWGDGIAPDGTAYQATQRNIRGNHIALVPQGRAGSECRIGDSLIQGASGMLNDAQLINFRDSDEGRLAIAYAKSVHDLTGWRSGPWNDQLERQALVDAMSAKTRSSPISDVAMADAAAKEQAAFQRSVAALNRSRN
jgi:hypothetical protein